MCGQCYNLGMGTEDDNVMNLDEFKKGKVEGLQQGVFNYIVREIEKGRQLRSNAPYMFDDEPITMESKLSNHGIDEYDTFLAVKGFLIGKGADLEMSITLGEMKVKDLVDGIVLKVRRKS